jgi:hypothetical protein
MYAVLLRCVGYESDGCREGSCEMGVRVRRKGGQVSMYADADASR